VERIRHYREVQNSRGPGLPPFAPDRPSSTGTADGKGGTMARIPTVATVSDHARRRLAQRNLTATDIQYVSAHGRLHHTGNATFVHLGLRDIPVEDRRDDRLRRLEGTVLVLDPATGRHLTTAYRNRQRGSRDIRRKLKRSIFRQGRRPSVLIELD
jgi:hypothetical protein